MPSVCRASYGGPFTCVSPLVNPRPRFRRIVPKRGKHCDPRRTQPDYSGRTSSGSDPCRRRPSSSLSHRKAGDEDPPLGAGLWRRFLGEVGTASQRSGEESIHNSATATVGTTVHLFIEGPSNPPPALGIGPHRSHDPTSGTPSRLHTFTLELRVHH
jgi:hypothetical protein